MLRLNSLCTNKKILLACLIIIIYLLTFKINYIRRCDRLAESSYIKTPDGVSIQKYNQTMKFKSFGELTQHCNGDTTSTCYNVKQKGETVFRQIQLSVLRMLFIIDKICTKHHIEYWIVRGTLLGAYRNKMSIPWDDDADIGLMAGEFEKFTKVILSEVPPDLSFQIKTEDPYNAHKKRLCIAKIRDIDTCYGYCLRRGCQWQDGIQIDVYQFHLKSADTENAYLYDETDLVGIDIPLKFISPTIRTSFEGLMLQAPNDIPNALSYMFKGDYNIIPATTCSEKSFVGIPWYGCNIVKSFTDEKLKELFTDTMLHNSLYFWYFG